MSRKLGGVLISALLVIGVGFAIYLSASKQFAAMQSTDVIGLSGSEKLPYFNDERVVNALADSPYRLNVTAEKAGSRQIATSYDLSDYDFAFPAGVPAAEKIKKKIKAKKSYEVFFTPMVIASWKPVVEVLEANGIVSKKDGIFYIVDMEKLFKLMIEKKRWTELANSSAYPANKSVLVTTTDIRKSNSAAMYLSLASYILNGNAIVQNRQQARQLAGDLGEIFLRQGFTESSSAIPFKNYLTMGPGKTPMVMIYEAQFLYELSRKDSPIRDDMMLLYPEPTLFTKHILIPLDEKGEKLGEALTTSETLLELAAEHGLRTSNTALFKNYFSKKNIDIPEFLVNVIEPPSYEVLEGMIQEIEQKYQQ